MQSRRTDTPNKFMENGAYWNRFLQIKISLIQLSPFLFPCSLLKSKTNKHIRQVKERFQLMHRIMSYKVYGANWLYMCYPSVTLCHLALDIQIRLSWPTIVNSMNVKSTTNWHCNTWCSWFFEKPIILACFKLPAVYCWLPNECITSFPRLLLTKAVFTLQFTTFHCERNLSARQFLDMGLAPPFKRSLNLSLNKQV